MLLARSLQLCFNLAQPGVLRFKVVCRALHIALHALAQTRDLVFDALRRRRSFAALGGAPTGRGLMLGLVRAAGTDPATLFTGEGFAPAPLSAEERTAGRAPAAES